MGIFERMSVVVVTTIAVTVIGIVYAQVGQPLLDLVTGDGPHTGFLSPTVGSLDTVIPLLLVSIELAVILWFIASSVEEERTVRRQP